MPAPPPRVPARAPTPAVSRYDPELDLLRDARTGQYAWVFATEGGRWRARAADHLNLGAHDTPADAARAVLAWLRGWYGDRWYSAFRSRKANPWKARRTAGGGWIVNVYYRNQPVTVTRATRFPDAPPPRRPPGVGAAEWGRMGEAYLWGSRAEAVAAAKAAMRAEVVRQLGERWADRKGRRLLLFWRDCGPRVAVSLAA